ncbi:MAG: glycosyltransferase family 2 protein [bacterium]|nr:glycosyltransferase family 2 protein [bacterium]
MKLTIVVSAFNEEEKIEECLKSASFADEIVFIDNSSADKTVEIAKKYTSKIFTRPNNLMLNVNKNFGFSKATGDWILSLDADERVTPELTKEIKEVIKNEKSKVAGYWIPRKNIIFGKWVQHTGWYPDHQMRLFRRGEGKFLQRHVHEMIQIKGKTGYLEEHMIHYNFESVQQFLHKHLNIYAPNEAEELLRKGYVFRWQDVITFPLKEFMNRFFAREGYKDGFHGLLLSIGMAFYHFIIFAYVWEKQGLPNIGDADFLTETESEFAKRHKEMKAWFINEKVKTAKNIIAKIKLKIAGRF